MATILVVDDHPTNRSVLVTLLTYRGYQLLEAANGAEALDLVRIERPDLVIADIVMPAMDGYEFVRHVRADPAVARTQVIFYTATYNEREARALARKCGVEYILSKPAEAQVILDTVDAALGTEATTQEVVSPDSFDRDHTRLLTDKLAGKVEELEATNLRLAALIDVGRRMATERNPRDLLQSCCQAAREIISAKYAAVGIAEDDRTALRHFFISGLDAATAARIGVPSAECGLLGRLWAEALRLRAADLQTADLPPGHPPARSFLGMPIASPARSYGWLYLADKLGAEEFSAEDEQILTLLAAQVAVAYENSQRYEALERHAAALEQEVAERVRAEQRQAMRVAVTRILAESDTRYEAIPLLLETIGMHTGCALGELWRVDARAGLLRWENNWHEPTLNIVRFEASSQITTIATGSGLCGCVWASAQPAWIADIAADTTFLHPSAAIGIGLRASLAFPVRGGSGVLGVMVFFYRDVRPPNADLLALLADIGSQIGQFFERKQAEEMLWQYTRRLRTLHTIDQAILALQSPEAIAQAALRHIRELVPCRRTSITAFDLAAGEAIIWAVETGEATALQPGMRYALEGYWGIDDLRKGHPTVIRDIRDVAGDRSELQFLLTEGLHSALNVPLVSQGELIGTLNLAADQPDSFTPEYIDIAREIGDQVAVAIQNARLFEQVRVGRKRLQLLSRQLVRAQEDERRHLARELHDEIGQSLTAAQLNLQALIGADSRELPARLEDSMALIEQVLQQVRTLSLDLRPSMLDDLGLVRTLRWYLNRQAERAGLTMQFVADPPEMRFGSETETTCFRVAQEALTNIIRHAQARQVSVDLSRRGTELLLRVHDDGAGFDVSAARARAADGASMGLLGMQERALLIGGQVAIESRPGHGTEVCARFPLPDTSGHEQLLERRKNLR